jgi:hypothetical protein
VDHAQQLVPQVCVTGGDSIIAFVCSVSNARRNTRTTNRYVTEHHECAVGNVKRNSSCKVRAVPASKISGYRSTLTRGFQIEVWEDSVPLNTSRPSTALVVTDRSRSICEPRSGRWRKLLNSQGRQRASVDGDTTFSASMPRDMVILAPLR